MEDKPSRMFEVLRGCGALARVLPEVDALCGVPQRADYHPEVDTGVHLMMVLDMAARLAASLPVRYACLGHDLGKAHDAGRDPAAPLAPRGAQRRAGAGDERTAARRQRLPRARRRSSRASTATSTAAASSARRRSSACSSAATRLRRPERFAEALLACECDARGRLGLEERPYPPARRASGPRSNASWRSTRRRSPKKPQRAASPARRSAPRSTTRACVRSPKPTPARAGAAGRRRRIRSARRSRPRRTRAP